MARRLGMPLTTTLEFTRAMTDLLGHLGLVDVLVAAAEVRVADADVVANNAAAYANATKKAKLNRAICDNSIQL